MERGPRAEASGVARAVECLERLQPHLGCGDIAVTGSLALHHHLQRAGWPPSRAVLDLDLVATTPSGIAPSAAIDFLVSHYHLPTLGSGKFFIQLVDPASGVRVDVLPDREDSVSRAAPESFGAVSVGLVEAADLFAHKLQTLRKASRDRPVDPKHLEDARALGRLLKREAPDIPSDHLAPNQYGSDLTHRCVRCHESRSPAFPLAPKQEIFALIGLV